MKYIITILLTVFSLSSVAMTAVEGKVVFDKGRYLVADTPIVGMSLQDMRKYEERQVKIQGVERESGEIEVYKISVKTDTGYQTTYDWDIVDQTYYGPGL
ncbi:hypothetical protein RED65_12229 [Oceanobacter sp. RED65]|uniref:Uncharacterized protein n=2 Tax=Bermanella marisrubri TaxID=207949 RepID=Q1N3N7_9GAMM|nr:hypothetical protein RED65_12229 [Oceanobacter sp. RED65] [Bermanella marisrubri]